MNLTNHFLVAMPSLQDPHFKRSVVYVCEHNDEGAMGIVINLPIDVSVGSMLDQIEVERDLPLAHPDSLKKPVMLGGPVAGDRGFILHNSKASYSSSLNVTDDIQMTTSKDILPLLGTKDEPSKYLVALGYAGWTAGQLEQELAENSWLTMEADPVVVFETPISERWDKAVAKLGIHSANLSSEVGHS
ncbi:YqgE/AlgH family protein [Photobacterium sp. GJ3]|uniref:YqgE/AlgH family protein n=1 Tax=Photobacterium sp. GJ3 TaxID=2829502 RepID=UPI001B8B2839|nr:YqgE/AlgH family protein [Photobacterium sp. GJ3]QUJ67024.1 YqgE/AlgH family protein [Photobacterium sp. GJ3]